MAFRSTKLWNSLTKPLLRHGSAATFTTATPPKMKAAAPATTGLGGHQKPFSSRAGDFVPVYVAVGLILLSASLGIRTAVLQMAHSPTVRVKKSRRETLPEVVEPESVAEESEKFLNKSFFRKVAHVQDLDAGDTVMANPAGKDAYAHRPKVESLRSIGVDPKP